MLEPSAGGGGPCRLPGEAVNALTVNEIWSTAVTLAGAAAPPLLWIHPDDDW